jgi:aminoglycoside phosphotransferase (APT) family kinase protein
MVVGDPAFDLPCASSALSAETRDVFRSALTIDDATWVRGRGFALSVAFLHIPYYKNTNPVLAGIPRHAIDEVVADHQHGSMPSVSWGKIQP